MLDTSLHPPLAKSAGPTTSSPFASDPGEGLFLGYSSPSHSPVPVILPPSLVTGDTVQVALEAPQASLDPAARSTDDQVDLVAVVEAAVAHALAACLGPPSLLGQAAERDTSGASGSPEEGATFLPDSLKAGPSLALAAVPLGLDWFAMPCVVSLFDCF